MLYEHIRSTGYKAGDLVEIGGCLILFIIETGDTLIPVKLSDNYGPRLFTSTPHKHEEANYIGNFTDFFNNLAGETSELLSTRP